MGELINSSVLILGTVAGICGISFYVREKEMGSLRVCIMLMGIFAALWCYGYGMMGMYTQLPNIAIARAVGMFSIIGYLGALLNLIIYLINMPMVYRKILTLCYIIYGMSDFIIMVKYSDHQYIRVGGRTAYYIADGFATSYHKIFLVIAMAVLFGIGFIWISNCNAKNLILVIILAHVCLVVSTAPDTLLPAFGLPSFPSTCYGVVFAYCILWYNCVHNNAFRITLQNVSTYVYQAMNVNILVFDMDKKLYMTNDSSDAFFRLSKVTGQKLSDLFEVEENKADEYFDNAVNGSIEELKLHTKKDKKSCSLHFTVAKDKGGKPYCVLIFVYDLTKEEEILDELKAANQAKNDFLSNMSHEIRTPINAIIGMNEMILREAKDEKLLEYASLVRNSSGELLSIVNEILDISKIESGQIKIKKTQVNENNYKYESQFEAPDARILVVDDIEVNLKVFTNLLKNLNMKIDTALSGEQCMELVCENQYDIIFMDHMMPGMSGIDTLEKMRENVANKNINTPVIMLTANALSGMKEMYLEKGFTDYLSKPLDGVKLEEKIQKYLPSQKVLEKTNSLEDADEKEGIKEKSLLRLQNEIKDMNLNKALQYCMGSEEFYMECLKDYYNNKRKEMIEKAYSIEDWKKYALEVHTLKSTSRTLGFETLGDIAEKMQYAAERMDILYVKKNHEDMVNNLEHILRAISECI